MVESVLLYVVLLILTGLLGLLIGIVIMLMRDNGSSSEKNVPDMVPIYNSGTAYGRVWRLELMNLMTRQVYRKDFNGQIILGRRTPGQELFWMMWLGDDASISRQHCVIFDRGGYLVLENLSQINMTMVDGMPLELPRYLQQGQVLGIGRSAFQISRLERIA